MTKNEIQQVDTFSNMEAVVIGGDLSKLTPEQRVQYYQSVCKSIGLNPLTRPFDYITLNGKLTLYARKDAADQLRDINGISIGKPDIIFQDEWIVVTVEASNKDGRKDSDVGVVSKKDMQGNYGNALMKAVTKAKRRVTLSICGLGWLDETEVETIPGAKPVVITETGEVKPTMTYLQAIEFTSPKGLRFGDMDRVKLQYVVDHGSSDQVEAALIVLAHDYNVEPVEDPAPQP